MRTALAISPHLDDAAFSAGGTLARLSRRGWRVVIATVFTANVARPQGFALACQTDKGLGADIDYMALRRAEDERACDALGCKFEHLPFLEAPHRGYDDADALFAGTLATDRITDEIVPQITALIEKCRPRIMFYPRAVGGHIDHLVVRKATLQAVARRALLAAAWTDWPYAAKARFTDPNAAEDKGRRVIDVRLREQDLARKVSASLCYESQVGFQFGGAAEAEASVRSVAEERFLC